MAKIEGEGLPSDLYQKDEFLNIINSKAENDELSASFCCVFFDIKGFRSYYMNNGFDEGYQVLVFLKNKIRDSFPLDIACKLDDGEFVVVTDIDDIERFISRIQRDFDEVYIHTGMDLHAGIYYINPDDKLAEEIIEKAVLACSSGDSVGNGIFKYNSENIDDEILMKHYVVHHIEDAIENGEITIAYQAVFHTLSGKVCGNEALARWNTTEYGVLMPKDFISVLEHSKKIYLLDSFVIKQVCKDQSEIIKIGMDPLPASINLTRLDFALVDIVGLLEEELEKNKLPKSLIRIEISEAEITNDKDGIKAELERLKDHGFSLIFDDFGSEYSSLHILNDMPFNAVKINSNFLSGYKDDVKPRVMLKNIINMSKELGIQTIMGSVEDEKILDFLKQSGCEQSQGHLYSEALKMFDYPIEQFPHQFESDEETVFYDAIGKVNVLSQTPMQDIGRFDPDNAYYNHRPIAIFEFDGKILKPLMCNNDFYDIFKLLFTSDVKSIQELFNSPAIIFAKDIKMLASQCVQDDEIHSMEFVTSNGFNRIMLRKITQSKALGKTAILATAEIMTENDAGTRVMQLNSYLKFLYMIYNRVDIVSVVDDTFETVYENTARYSQKMKKGSFSDAIKKFADEAIYNEDRTDFIEFYNLNSLDERISEYGTNHITDYFRTKDINGEYDWLMYLLIPIVSEGDRMFIMCSRTLDAERMRKLPDISQSGSEYYDMPSDPTFLLLASDAFTETLGYGSFEQFIRNTFYLEANLTEDKTVYMHLGQTGLISDFGETGYIQLPFGEVTRSMVFSQAEPEEHEKMYEFYNRDRLLKEYENGNTSGRIVYLEKTGSSEKPRYQNACYQIRRNRQDDGLHIYILKYDIDQFKRTNETIRNLAERDTLTGLFNRMTIGKVYEAFISDPETKSLAMILLDLDFFKQINDKYGHHCGDKVLQDAANRMQNDLGSDVYPSRIGGDEFLVIIRNHTDKEVDAALKAFSEAEKTVDYNGEKVKYTMSVGYAVYPEDGKAYNDLYRNADNALYYVKENGKNNYGKYDKRR
ncbi:bifunctional diguanylate cyclase/phosphodiesterase [Butyrivibrio sp. AD3002]|uniref:bifunctional diguanylate cyclase/phosphodiesterase n=1 Tax=Butyrivibrio sp. AD3002 TaxID=1280670 RepID=UPI0003B3CFAF|nr:EAL domain-containing protein [Butyrivibrio sp. AD3002]